MPRIESVPTRMQTEMTTSKETLQRKSQMSGLSTLSQCSNANKKSCLDSIIDCIKSICNTIIYCITCQWLCGKKEEKNVEQSSATAPQQTQKQTQTQAASTEVISETREDFLKPAAVKKKFEEYVALMPKENEPYFIATDWVDRSLDRDKHVTSFLSTFSGRRDLFIAYRLVYKHFFTRAYDHYLQELEKFKKDKTASNGKISTDGVEKAIVNLLRTIHGLAEYSMSFTSMYSDENIKLDQLMKQLHGVTTENVYAVDAGKLVKEAYEAFKLATGQNEKDLKEWTEKWEKTSLGYIDELFKEKIRLLDQKKYKLIENALGKGKTFWRFNGYGASLQVPNCLKNTKDDE